MGRPGGGAEMVPLDAAGVDHARSWLGEPAGPGLLALGHALAFGRPGLWGDDARRPRGVILLRRGDEGWEAFGAGDPGPAAGWLAECAGAVALLAPEDWEDAIRAAVGPVARSTVQTWAPTGPILPGPPVPAHRLTAAADDAFAFAEVAPGWALRGWGSYADLIEHGAAFGVPHAGGLAAVAWIFDQSRRHDALAVATAPRFRRLGLGHAAAFALIAHVVRDRHKFPLWSTPPDNAASTALASALGLTVAALQTLLRWAPRAGDVAYRI